MWSLPTKIKFVSTTSKLLSEGEWIIIIYFQFQAFDLINQNNIKSVCFLIYLERQYESSTHYDILAR